MRPWKTSLDSDVLLITALFGVKKKYSAPSGAFICCIQIGAFQLIKSSIMITQHFVRLIYSCTHWPANLMPLMAMVEYKKPFLLKPVLGTPQNPSIRGNRGFNPLHY